MLAKKKRKSTPKQNHALTADTSDRHVLYENSVQCTEASIDIIDEVFSREHGRKPRRLREDFCGTAKLCADWASSDDRRTATGIDNDPDTLAWGTAHNLTPLSPGVQRRVSLVQSDVLECREKGFDVVAAFNFSYWIFKKREILAQYLRNAYESLEPGGLFLLDIYGGPDSQFVLEEETEHEGFTYVWDQDYVDPINNHIICHIHYRFPDDSEMTKAFTYDWRIWSVPEMRDLLTELGFKRIEVWWDCEDDELRPKTEVENLESWVAYLAAWR